MSDLKSRNSQPLRPTKECGYLVRTVDTESLEENESLGKEALR